MKTFLSIDRTLTEGSVSLELHIVCQKRFSRAYENKELKVPSEPRIRTNFHFLLFCFTYAWVPDHPNLRCLREAEG
jgi:hypothetical protein